MKYFSTSAAFLFLMLTFAARAEAQDLGHGFNFGNMLEVPPKADWGMPLKDSYFTTIEQAGFSVIRVPISWQAHAQATAPFTIEPTFFQTVDGVVAQAQAHHLKVILDFHNFPELGKDPAGQEARFLTLWKQVAEHYQSASDDVLFEIFNEPADKLNAATWNQLLAKALAVIRATNPTRWVVVGGVHWNSYVALPSLVLPEADRRLLVTIHFYDPMKFTHQGASWIKGSKPWMGTTWQGTDAEKKAVDQAMDQAAEWGKAHNRPIYMGEFGSFSTSEMDSRARWTGYVARSAEAHGFSWTYWEFCAGFGAYDAKNAQWREPLLHALKPDATP